MFEKEIKINRLIIKSGKDIINFLNDYFLNSLFIFCKIFKKIDEGLYKNAFGIRFKIQKNNDHYFVDVWKQIYMGFIIPKNLFFFSLRTDIWIKYFFKGIIYTIQSFDENSEFKEGETIVKGKFSIIIIFLLTILPAVSIVFAAILITALIFVILKIN